MSEMVAFSVPQTRKWWLHFAQDSDGSVGKVRARKRVPSGAWAVFVVCIPGKICTLPDREGFDPGIGH